MYFRPTFAIALVQQKHTCKGKPLDPSLYRQQSQFWHFCLFFGYLYLILLC